MISNAASGLLFEIDAPLYQDFYFSKQLKKTYYEEFMYLEYLFLPENLPFTYRYILRNMYSRLKSYIDTIHRLLHLILDLLKLLILLQDLINYMNQKIRQIIGHLL